MAPAEMGPAVPPQAAGPGEQAAGGGGGDEAAPRGRSRLVVVRPRPAGPKPRRARRRAHPVGPRACSGLTRAKPAGTGPDAAGPDAAGPDAAGPDAVTGPDVTAPRPDAAAPGSGQPSPLRLTRRGRVVAAIGTAVLAGLLCLLAATAAGATAARVSGHGTSPGAARAVLSQVVVQPGQTLWTIASQADPGGDPRLVIQQIVKLNRLSGENLAAGQRLWVPRG